MHLLTSRTLLALCSLVMFSFEGACSRRIARSSSYSTTNISCDKENGLNYYRDNPMLAPEIQTLQLVKRPLRSTDLIYHYGVLATLESGLKVLIDKGSDFCGGYGRTMAVPIRENLGQEWSYVGRPVVTIPDYRVFDAMRDSGPNYHLINDNCRHAAERIMSNDLILLGLRYLLGYKIRLGEDEYQKD